LTFIIQIACFFFFFDANAIVCMCERMLVMHINEEER
jgi:hypothetical protein